MIHEGGEGERIAGACLVNQMSVDWGSSPTNVCIYLLLPPANKEILIIYLLFTLYEYNFLIFCALRGGGVVQRMEENHQDASQEDAAEAKEAAAKEKADRAEKKQQAKEEAKKETLYKLMR